MSEPYRPDATTPHRDPAVVAMSRRERDRIADFRAWDARTWRTRCVDPRSWERAMQRLGGGSATPRRETRGAVPRVSAPPVPEARQLTLADRLEALASRVAA